LDCSFFTSIDIINLSLEVSGIIKPFQYSPGSSTRSAAVQKAASV
jgi:hypothetical protein